MSHESPCEHSKSTREMLNKMDSDIKDSFKDFQHQLNNIHDKFINRPPVWATVLISVLSAITSGMMTLLLK